MSPLQPITSRNAVSSENHHAPNNRGSRTEPDISLSDPLGHRNSSSSNRSPRIRPSSKLPTPEKNTAAAFGGAHDFSIGGNAHVVNVGKAKRKTVNIQNNYSGTSGIDTLKPFVSFEALFDSSAQDPQRRVHPGTRESVLKKMGNWIDNPDITRPMLWLRGPAGAGKSAIAQTISHSYGQKELAATFFFFRSDPRRSDGNLLFPTLAWQLAKSVRGARNHIVNALNDDPDLPTKSIEVQFESLIAQPLRSIAAASHSPSFSPVILIDGVDECLDEKLQQRFLDVLGQAARDNRTRLRVLISSRPEEYIKDIMDQFRSATLEIDLANVDDAYRDVEKYLREKFAAIASKQKIDQKTWPGNRVIEDLTSKSSGHFIYASTIIKFVGDQDYGARSQLEIVLGLKPSKFESPFAELDALYIEILRRQRHQGFVKEFLAILIFRSRSAFSPSDDALLMKVDKKELCTNLRRMHSLLKIGDGSFIDVHHRSFLDFLQEHTRSKDYYFSGQSAAKRYLERIVDVLVRQAPNQLKQTANGKHFHPLFGALLADYQSFFDLPYDDMEEVLHPLYKIKDESLRSSNSSPPCDNCDIFRIIDNLLLHLALLRQNSQLGNEQKQIPPIRRKFSRKMKTALRNVNGVFPILAFFLRGIKALKGKTDLESYLSSLLRNITDRNAFERTRTMNLFCELLRFDYTDTASKIQSIRDAQNLIDFIHHVTNTKELLDICSRDTALNALQLALRVYARVPLIPQFYVKGMAVDDRGRITKNNGKDVSHEHVPSGPLTSVCQAALISRIISHENVSSLLYIYCWFGMPHFVYSKPGNGSIRAWRHNSSPSDTEIWERMLEVAETVQFINSLGLVLGSPITSATVGLDSSFRAKVPACCLSPPDPRHVDRFKPDGRDTFNFGLLFYDVYFDVAIPPGEYKGYERKTVVIRPNKLGVDENVWELIQRCCGENQAERPTMDEVVAEMKSWK